jgi:hypothetical protein
VALPHNQQEVVIQFTSRHRFALVLAVLALSAISYDPGYAVGHTDQIGPSLVAPQIHAALPQQVPIEQVALPVTEGLARPPTLVAISLRHSSASKATLTGTELTPREMTLSLEGARSS